MIIKKLNLILLFSFASCLSTMLLAQSAGGNLSIGENGVVYVYGEHSFVNGGGLINPGMIETSRNGSKGYLIFSSGSSWKGAGEGRFVNGYVQVLHDQSFVFPIGANNLYRPVGISGAKGATAAYYQENPLTIGSKINRTKQRISQQEYWDITADQSTTITLTWGKESAIQQLTDGKLENLTIVGLKDGQWIPIASTVLGKSAKADFAQGVISTTDAIIPSDYQLFTLGNMTTMDDQIAIVKVFPNPVMKDLYVDIKKSGIKKGSILIFDVNGRQMIERQFDDVSKAVQHFDVSNYANGLFKVQVKSADLQITEQFIINNTK